MNKLEGAGVKGMDSVCQKWSYFSFMRSYLGGDGSRGRTSGLAMMSDPKSSKDCCNGLASLTDLGEQEAASENGRFGFEILEEQFLVTTKSRVSPWWSETKLIRNELEKKNLYV